MAKIEKCSCEETQFLRSALESIGELCEDDTPVSEARYSVCEVASEALGDPAPGGARPCSCPEALHLRRALRACFNVTQAEGKTTRADIACDDLAQCNNLADQGLKLRKLTGDPGVYAVASYIPAEGDASALYLGAARDAVGLAALQAGEPANEVAPVSALLDKLTDIRNELVKLETPGTGTRPGDVQAIERMLDSIAENAVKLRGDVQYGKDDKRGRALVRLVRRSLGYTYP